ncbi:hypothetical protein DP116_13315 [Brasilonema bromeliae SPC951]|uniref:Uncharacterized protein n=1 Tax=Brasilonema bromeliae SPC951 TaxID=385972 RepID=A0ABX1PA99_9CYAN|nr:hypothetical protein [Brasilonema bromeliae SPC951]
MPLQLPPLVLGLLAAGDLLPQLGVDGRQPRQGKRPRQRRDEGQHGRPGGDRGDELDHPGQAVSRVPEERRLDGVADAAAQHEGGEQPEHRQERHVPPAEDEVRQQARDGEVGGGDTAVGQDVEPAVEGGPEAARPAGHEPVGGEQAGGQVEHVSPTVGPPGGLSPAGHPMV